MSKPVLLSLGAGKVQELVGTANNDVLTWNSATSEWVSAAGGGGGGSGTVTSVGLTGGTSGIVIGGTTSPITTSGTYNLDAPQRFAFDTTSPIAPTSPGQMSWNATEGSLNTLMAGGNVDAVVGQQLYQRAVNADTVTLTKGMVVYVFGSSGTRATVKRATADADLSSATILGVVAESIAQNAEGFIITNGLLKDLSVLPSTTFADGDVVYLSPTTAGGLTPTKPTAPQHLVMVGYCVKASNGAAGVLLVHPQNGYELGELHDVYINSPTSGQILIYDATTGQTRWENASLTGGTGVTVTPGPGSLSVAIGQDVGTSASVTFAQVTTTVFNSPTGVFDFTGGSGSTTYISPPAAATATNLSLEAGAASTGNANGGNAYLLGGVKSGTGTNGTVSVGTSNTSAVTVGATGITTTINGTLSLANALTVGNGGTGATTLTGYVKGNGASAMTASATVPTSDLSGTVSLTSQVSGTLPVANGGTNNGSLSVTQGTVYYGDGTKLVGLAPGTSGHFLKTNGAGADPEWAAAGGGGSTPYDLSGEFVGTPTSSAVIMRFVAARAFTFGGTAQFACVTGPTSTATFTVNVNGVSKGTVTIATSGTSGSGSITSTSIVAGDLITVVATTPAAIVSPYWTLPGTV